MLALGLSGHFGGEDTDLVPGLPESYSHDAAACLVADGKLVAAVEEERFNRIKKTTKFPVNAVRACLEIAGVGLDEVDVVGYYFDEVFSDNALNTWYAAIPQIPVRSARRLIQDKLAEGLGVEVPDERVRFTRHHDAHAWSSFLRSGMDQALVAVLDGRGEEESGTLYRAGAGDLELLDTQPVHASLGLFYQEAISLVRYGFGDEYKVMGLAPYGDAKKYREVFDSLYTLHDEGRYELTPGTPWLNTVASRFLAEGFAPRRTGEPVTQQHQDFAAGVQEMLENVVMHVLRHWAKVTGLRKFCFGGGVAHNSSLNGLILRSGLFDEVFVHPASHDGGASEGAALAAALQAGWNRTTQPRMRTASLGPTLGDRDEIAARLKAWGDQVEVEPHEDIVEVAANLMAEGKVLGWAHGRSEFGPRALGNRSILADARPSDNRTRINAMVKKRESFRPFAPAVTAEAADTYFDLTDTKADHDFMSFVVYVHEDRREELGATTHVDGSARVQVVEAESNPRFHRLIQRFGEITGTPVLLNTSFNNNAEPIVQTVDDVVTSYLTTDLDYLVVEDFLVRRRPGAVLDDLVVRFRPVTRLRMSWNHVAGPDAEHEIYLDYTKGPRTVVSAEVFALLSAVDGRRTLSELAGGEVSEEVRKVFHDLWQGRLVELLPRGDV
ncbi:carbamoyltransferase C-terminal domain-containing protein [Saccharothrix sp.]|uniref:carbamoyltransferase family protein n=1 Tax=Saccharothrix sp. TaxID=1873460 RepID=UPI0028111642|nr:carbamoyltransferase C-terminal domain-containing protein [Saccharothrix sp.]